MNIDENNNLGDDTTKKGEDSSTEKLGSESKELFSTPPPITPEANKEEQENIDLNKELTDPSDPNNKEPELIPPPLVVGISSIAVVRNDGQNKITILSGGMRWIIEKNAQIPMTSIPTWVKQHPEFQAFRRDKILIYTNMVAQKKQF